MLMLMLRLTVGADKNEECELLPESDGLRHCFSEGVCECCFSTC